MSGTTSPAWMSCRLLATDSPSMANPALYIGASHIMQQQDSPKYEVDLKTDLLKAFKAINTPGTFAAWEALPTTPPAGLHVNGLGEIPMPLGQAQLQRLITIAHQAPYGRGSETLVDLSVRNTWEIHAHQLLFLDAAWQGYLFELSKLVAGHLGITGPIRMELYKMLIYEPGAMCKPHTDTERTPGMFGTLIICLPSAHTGGEVLVRHNRECKVLRSSDATQSFACWYSDVTHEVLPVHSGYRCVLTYNLAVTPGLTRPAAGALDFQRFPLRKTLYCWLGELANNDATDVPTHLYHALDHEYTNASMSFSALKGKDWARVQALQAVAHEFPFEIFLALLEKKEDGPVDDHYRDKHRGFGWGRCAYAMDSDGDDDEDDEDKHHELTEVSETSYTVESLRTLDGRTVARDYPFDMCSCLLNDPFELLKIAEEEYEPYMGNWGPSATHWYRRSAVVIVPRQNLAAYLAQCTSESEDESNFYSALGHLRKTFSHPADFGLLLDAMSVLAESLPTGLLVGSTITEMLTTALQCSHYKLFQTVSAHHKGQLPVKFFDWANGWLDTLPYADRAEMYKTWMPLPIQGYPSVADRISAIVKISSNPMYAPAGLVEALPSVSTWAQDQILQVVTGFLEETKNPAAENVDVIMSAVIYLDETRTSALLTSIFVRFPGTNAIAFLLVLLSRLKAQIAVAHPSSIHTTELYRILSLRVFNRDRKLADIITEGKNKSSYISQAGQVVTPPTLVQFACDLHDMSTDTTDLLQQFIQEIVEQLSTFSAVDMRNFWIPFLHQLIPALLSRSVLLTTPTYQRLICDSIMTFIKVIKSPTVADVELIMPPVIHLNETVTAALFKLIFEHLPNADAIPFLLALLSRLKAQAEAAASPDSNTRDLYRSLSPCVFNSKRKLSCIPTKGKLPPIYLNNNPKTEQAVTPEALLRFACDLSDMSTNADLLQSSIQEINAQCATFSAADMRELWMPFLYQLIPALVSRSLSLNTPAYQQLTQQFIKHLNAKTVGICPQATSGTVSQSPQVTCACPDCGKLNQFLQATSQRVGSFSMAQSRRMHLEQQLVRARIDCTCTTARTGSPQTLVVTKHYLLKDKIGAWNKRQKEFYTAVSQRIKQEHLKSLLGDEQATRIQSLATLNNAGTTTKNAATPTKNEATPTKNAATPSKSAPATIKNTASTSKNKNVAAMLMKAAATPQRKK
ncbi:uncharacterized protein PGTG_17069 [Puccinia graminis f. sp. tritici CRL 75-36-700-3]|uniref:Prolyl 4-hydroxylase alpha subunit Fe(2+) 2OG dioxygenase domain-containing protein n=1 Tax=Puccinia graminis f. sp. tritici (strain CRL 75-36-700-3 / race SCCL) TaxID=418459 RepID=E3L2U5_PUCGT|nr:uncharacterized protein PGTG_17069 [Puccinia graminis f. sp. tritici CRL 75-36-700-3]EFP90870.2 hypothetical protein PGTG_17069 [Puccinia graminis f. sp. tritici CRL 75-36-700-3]